MPHKSILNLLQIREHFDAVLLRLIGFIFILLYFSELSIPSLPPQRNFVIYRTPGIYAAFPSIYVDKSYTIWVSFGWNKSGRHGRIGDEERGAIIMSTADPMGHWKNSTNGPLELDRNIVVYPNGSSVKLAHHGWEQIDTSRVEKLKQNNIYVRYFPEEGYFAGFKLSLVLIDSNGKPRTRIIRVEPPMQSIFGFGKMIQTSSGVLLKPVYSTNRDDIRISSAWVLRSLDFGENWATVRISEDSKLSFSESSLLEAGNREIIAIIRSLDWARDEAELREKGYLWLARSYNDGGNWSEPEKTPIWGYPGTLLKLPDGRILCTYGYRRSPYGIRACISEDGGHTWLIEDEIVLRDDALPESPGFAHAQPHDLGYPWTVLWKNDTLITVYYTTDSKGVTYIAGTIWMVPPPQSH